MIDSDGGDDDDDGGDDLDQGCSIPVLRAHCPIYSRCFPDPTHLIQMMGRDQASTELDHNPFIGIRWVDPVETMEPIAMIAVVVMTTPETTVAAQAYAATQGCVRRPLCPRPIQQTSQEFLSGGPHPTSFCWATEDGLCLCVCLACLFPITQPGVLPPQVITSRQTERKAKEAKEARTEQRGKGETEREME